MPAWTPEPRDSVSSTGIKDQQSFPEVQFWKKKKFCVRASQQKRIRNHKYHLVNWKWIGYFLRHLKSVLFHFCGWWFQQKRHNTTSKSRYQWHEIVKELSNPELFSQHAHFSVPFNSPLSFPILPAWNVGNKVKLFPGLADKFTAQITEERTKTAPGAGAEAAESTNASCLNAVVCINMQPNLPILALWLMFSILNATLKLMWYIDYYPEKKTEDWSLMKCGSYLQEHHWISQYPDVYGLPVCIFKLKPGLSHTLLAMKYHSQKHTFWSHWKSRQKLNVNLIQKFRQKS